MRGVTVAVAYRVQQGRECGFKRFTDLKKGNNPVGWFILVKKERSGAFLTGTDRLLQKHAMGIIN